MVRAFDVYVDGSKLDSVDIKRITTLDFPWFGLKKKRINELRKRDGDLKFDPISGELQRESKKI
jgi:hypothetical protein